MSLQALFNGRELDPVLAGTRGLNYGDGVFRTLLVIGGCLVDLDRQLQKLRDDAQALDLDPPDHALLRGELETLAQAPDEDAALRVTLSRADSGRGYAPAGRTCDRLIHRRPLPASPRSCWTDGIEARWSPVLLGIQPRLAGIKHLNRLEQVLASRDWEPDQHEALMCDAEGRVTCGTRSNAFFVIDHLLVTPEVSRAGVAGMMRARLIELTRANGIGCEIGVVSPDEVRHASEAFVCNSLIGIWPLRRIGSRLELPAPGPVTRRVMELLAHPWSGA
ncbi:MAG: aminodeoxychorismate lyase [Panacagrimonas sp.]